MGLGGIALASLLDRSTAEAATQGVLPVYHHKPRAKRIIFLFQSGGPSQLDMLDYKPELNHRHGSQLPEEVRMGQRLTAMSGNQASLPLVGSPFRFQQHGESGTWMSDLLPYTAQVADQLCVIRSMHTDAINHGPATTFIQTGSQFPGRPSMGSWLSYGLGAENENLPSFVVLVTKDKSGQPLVSRLWGSGFLPAKHQGVRFRSGKDPILYLGNPAGIDLQTRRRMLTALRRLHELQLEDGPDPEIETKISQYELAFRMQTSVPEVTDISDEPEHVLREYGEDVRNPGSYAANCLLARRLAERDVRFIQLYHQGWDQHGNLVKSIRQQCRETDQATAALVCDLARRGLLDETLVVWGGEFGRTNYCQGKLNGDQFGRDHHPRCFSMWMAGGGVRSGTSYGETGPLGYNIASNPVHIHDLQATILHLLGIDHTHLNYKYQGRHFRLTDVHGEIVQGILA
jgi:hypothetical protein